MSAAPSSEWTEWAVINKGDALQHNLRLFDSSQRRSPRLPSGAQITAISSPTKIKSNSIRQDYIHLGNERKLWLGLSRVTSWQLGEHWKINITLFSSSVARCGCSRCTFCAPGSMKCSALMIIYDFSSAEVISSVVKTSPRALLDYIKSLYIYQQRVAEMKEGLMEEIKDHSWHQVNTF